MVTSPPELAGGWLTWRGVLGARAVWSGLAVTVAVQIGFTYAPPLQELFGSAPLGPAEAAAVLALGPLLLAAIEGGKRIARERSRI